MGWIRSYNGRQMEKQTDYYRIFRRAGQTQKKIGTPRRTDGCPEG